MSIEGTLLEKLLIEQQRTNDLLTVVLEELQNGLHIKQKSNDKNYVPRSPLTQDDMDALDEEIDLDYWFDAFGEEILPARYMNQSGTPYSKQELDYLYRRLTEIASVQATNEQGTHVFTSVGKVWCKREKKPLNCFAFKPVKNVLDQMKEIQDFQRKFEGDLTKDEDE